MGDICNVRVLRSAECDTDHKLVRGKFKLRIRRKVRKSGVKVPKRINVFTLAQQDIQKAFSDTMNNISFEGTWEDFKTQVHKAGVDLLGFVKKKQHKDWFGDNDANI